MDSDAVERQAAGIVTVLNKRFKAIYKAGHA